MSGATIGIDFGTSYLRVGICRNNEFELIYNEMHKPKTPCNATFEDGKCIIESSSVQYIEEHLHNTVFCAKRLIGLNYSEAVAQAKKHSWPFKIKRNADKEPVIELVCKGQKVRRSVVEIVSLFFSKAKEMAECHLQQVVEGAIVTIPVGYSSSQVEATLNAGIIAGFKTLDAIHETHAAAFAYYAKQSKTALLNKETILMLHLGGGSFGVSVFEISNKLITPLHTMGDAHLGGVEFDTAIFEHTKTKVDYQFNEVELFRLYRSCEKAKTLFASCSEAKVQCFPKADIKIKINEFEEIDDVKKYFETITTSVENITNRFPLVGKIVFVGGSTRIKAIQVRLEKLLPDKQMNQSLNDEAAVYGAARVASFSPDIRCQYCVIRNVDNQLATDRLQVLAQQNEERVIREREDKQRKERLNTIETSIYAMQKNLGILWKTSTNILSEVMKLGENAATDLEIKECEELAEQLEKSAQFYIPSHFRHNVLGLQFIGMKDINDYECRYRDEAMIPQQVIGIPEAVAYNTRHQTTEGAQEPMVRDKHQLLVEHLMTEQEPPMVIVQQTQPMVRQHQAVERHGQQIQQPMVDRRMVMPRAPPIVARACCGCNSDAGN